VAEFLESRGVHNYLVEIAGASRSRGVNAKGEPWKLAIQKPTDELDEVQAIVKPDGRAISTSGSYRNYYELDGQRYSHIIDPATGKPITHRLVSATVITPTALEADGLDTALMVMGPEKAMAFAKQQRLAVYLVIKTDKGFKAEYSESFEPYLVQPGS
jgi:thiamine biosynthesis lipoprotein